MIGRKFKITSLILVWLLLPGMSWAAKSEIVTVWPLLDYRRSPAADYTSIHILGPVLKFERKGNERAFALRPLYSRHWDASEGAGTSETLYPIGSGKWSAGAESYQGLHLLQSDFGPTEQGSENEFTLFPFLFYGKGHAGQESYFAFFPFGGTIREKFGRDEIRFALFPLYSRTRKGRTTHTHALWPILSRTDGENESGWKFWPLAGAAEKEGVYRKGFFLWPVFFSEDLRLDGENPERRRAAFPFYLRQESPRMSSTTVLWPFFSHHLNREKDGEEWNFPWPLLRISRGSYHSGWRVLPFHADERVGATRKRWFLWPVYKIEELHTDVVDRRRDRVLYFLFSHLEEEKVPTGDHLRRVALWPLFTYTNRNGLKHFRTLALLEPFFPESGGIERNWAPLWSVYQLKRDGRGNEVSSLFWNLYWKERQGESLALELFPLFSFYRNGGDAEEWRLLKGLFSYRQDRGGRNIRLLYLPWSFSWDEGPDMTTSMVQ